MSEERDYLLEELKEMRRGLRIGVWGSVAIVVLIMVYFGWLRAQLSDALEPRSLAELVVSEARRNLPEARDALKENIRKAAPEVVAFVTTRVMDEALPMVRQSAEALFREYSREMAGFGKEAVVKIFAELVKDHKADLQESGKHHSGAIEAVLAQRERARKAGKKPLDAAYVEVVGTEIDTRAIAERLSRYVDAELGNRLSDSPQETLRQKLDESVNALKRINKQLENMAENRKLSREDQMGKRLITTWWTFLNRRDGPSTVEQAMLESLPIPKTAEDLAPVVR